MVYVDENLKPGSTSTLNQLSLGYISVSVGCYVCLTSLFNSNEMLEFSFTLFAFVMCVLYCLGGIYQIIEGRRTVSSITFLSGRFELLNTIAQKITIKENEVKSVVDGNNKWFVRPSIAFQTDLRSFMIHLKDGRFFRVSPHMERIDELKSELEKIIEQTKELELEKDND